MVFQPAWDHQVWTAAAADDDDDDDDDDDAGGGGGDGWWWWWWFVSISLGKRVNYDAYLYVELFSAGFLLRKVLGWWIHLLQAWYLWLRNPKRDYAMS